MATAVSNPRTSCSRMLFSAILNAVLWRCAGAQQPCCHASCMSRPWLLNPRDEPLPLPPSFPAPAPAALLALLAVAALRWRRARSPQVGLDPDSAKASEFDLEATTGKGPRRSSCSICSGFASRGCGAAACAQPSSPDAVGWQPQAGLDHLPHPLARCEWIQALLGGWQGLSDRRQAAPARTCTPLASRPAHPTLSAAGRATIATSGGRSSVSGASHGVARSLEGEDDVVLSYLRSLSGRRLRAAAQEAAAGAAAEGGTPVSAVGLRQVALARPQGVVGGGWGCCRNFGAVSVVRGQAAPWGRERLGQLGSCWPAPSCSGSAGCAAQRGKPWWAAGPAPQPLLADAARKQHSVGRNTQVRPGTGRPGAAPPLPPPLPSALGRERSCPADRALLGRACSLPF